MIRLLHSLRKYFLTFYSEVFYLISSVVYSYKVHLVYHLDDDRLETYLKIMHSLYCSRHAVIGPPLMQTESRTVVDF